MKRNGLINSFRRSSPLCKFEAFEHNLAQSPEALCIFSRLTQLFVRNAHHDPRPLRPLKIDLVDWVPLIRF
jgi:hypothetical protein